MYHVYELTSEENLSHDECSIGALGVQGVYRPAVIFLRWTMISLEAIHKANGSLFDVNGLFIGRMQVGGSMINWTRIRHSKLGDSTSCSCGCGCGCRCSSPPPRLPPLLLQPFRHFPAQVASFRYRTLSLCSSCINKLTNVTYTTCVPRYSSHNKTASRQLII